MAGKDASKGKGFAPPKCSEQKKPCFGRGKCDESTGKCTCEGDKFSGDLCDKVKDYKFPACAKAKIPCNGLGKCDLKASKCVC